MTGLRTEDWGLRKSPITRGRRENNVMLFSASIAVSIAASRCRFSLPFCRAKSIYGRMLIGTEELTNLWTEGLIGFGGWGFGFFLLTAHCSLITAKPLPFCRAKWLNAIIEELNWGIWALRDSGIDEFGHWEIQELMKLVFGWSLITVYCSLTHRGRADVRFSVGIEESDSLHRSAAFFIVFIENKIPAINEIKELRPFPLYLPCICNEKLHLQSSIKELRRPILNSPCIYKELRDFAFQTLILWPWLTFVYGHGIRACPGGASDPGFVNRRWIRLNFFF